MVIMGKEPQTKRTDKSMAGIFWDRAQQCAHAMNEALQEGHWEAAGINAVHCAISANDALLIALRGIRPASQDHKDAVRVLQSRFKEEDAQKAAKRLGTVIAKKSRVEYEEKRMTEREAREIVLDAQRFMDWAKTRLPKRL
ncbi:MAG: HEPN domain-containing protein [Actinobacteria bacterium]|jgi:HEPN domain-containing protein|nr:MAG: HEPN domain-containing protein [Actinomycetota bacterium]